MSHARQCDGVRDCPGGEDEAECRCVEGDFQCSDLSCVLVSAVCDGVKDCPEGEDEAGQDCADWTCSPGRGGEGGGVVGP